MKKCNICNINNVNKNGINKKSGKQQWCSICSACRRTNPSYLPKNVRYRAFKKAYCELCEWIAEHPCQLDVDHIDGDHTNDKETNLQTLCATCHRLKTFNQLYSSK